MEDFEHALLLIVLFIALLNARPPRQRLTIPLLTFGLLLAFVRPAIPVDIPWNAVLFVTVPLVLWQGARRVVTAKWWDARIELALWLVASLLFSVLFVIVGSLELPHAILLGVLLGSILWRSVRAGAISRPLWLRWSHDSV